MIKIDLITGFLGSGKTTFIRKYARYLTEQGLHIGIIENDFGAINVDMLLLQDIESEQCELEAIVGGNVASDWKRRFKAKLILFALQGMDRIIVEPSGIYDVNIFKEILYDESVSSKYEIGNIFTIVDAGLEKQLSEKAENLLVSQIASCGRVIVSKLNQSSEEQIRTTTKYLSNLLNKYRCDRNIENSIFAKNWDELSGEDFQLLMNSGWVDASYRRLSVDQEDAFTSLFFMNMNLPKDKITTCVKQLFKDPTCGNIFRIKGFFEMEDETWLEVNATREHLATRSVEKGQKVLIVIGEDLNKEAIEAYFN
ncbi:GTP-binding protein [Anaerosporobacter faecicola]|uniref:GTP-binding protein n=1 Tax=Anaerosporobacter faecicola TaxID=2718714 RepID=UPI00143961D9|nr:GTP-binding protein [Anaerosporobacter faecicola]